MPRIFKRRHKLVKLNSPRALEYDTDDKLSDGEMLLDFLLVASINQPLPRQILTIIYEVERETENETNKN
jgi:hypothetical protein